MMIGAIEINQFLSIQRLLNSFMELVDPRQNGELINIPMYFRVFLSVWIWLRVSFLVVSCFLHHPPKKLIYTTRHSIINWVSVSGLFLAWFWRNILFSLHCLNILRNICAFVIRCNEIYVQAKMSHLILQFLRRLFFLWIYDSALVVQTGMTFVQPLSRFLIDWIVLPSWLAGWAGCCMNETKTKRPPLSLSFFSFSFFSFLLLPFPLSKAKVMSICRGGKRESKYPTGPFTILEPQDQEIGEFYLFNFGLTFQRWKQLMPRKTWMCFYVIVILHPD